MFIYNRPTSSYFYYQGRARGQLEEATDHASNRQIKAVGASIKGQSIDTKNTLVQNFTKVSETVEYRKAREKKTQNKHVE